MPFILDNGQHLRLGVEPIQETRLGKLQEITDHMETAMNEAHSALEKTADDMAHIYDMHPIYKAGDKVGLIHRTLQPPVP